MTKNQAAGLTVIVAFMAFWVYVGTVFTIAHSFTHDTQNQVKIECFLHRDNADVHKLCVDHGYDH